MLKGLKCTVTISRTNGILYANNSGCRNFYYRTSLPVLNANKLVSSVEAGGILAQHPSPSMYDRYMYPPYPLSY